MGDDARSRRGFLAGAGIVALAGCIATGRGDVDIGTTNGDVTIRARTANENT